MKHKGYYFILFIILFPFLTFGQALVSLTAGYSHAGFFDNAAYIPFFQYGDPYQASYNSKTGFSINLASTFRKGKNWNLGNSLTYIYKPFHIKSQSTTLAGQYNQDADYKLNYLYYSVFPEYSFGKKVKINCAAGISAGWLFYSYYKGEFFNILGGTVNDTHREGNANSLFHFYDMRFMFKVGFKIPLKKRTFLIIENQFSLPLTKITAGKFGEGAVSVNSRDFSFSVGVGWLLLNEDEIEEEEF